MKKLFFLTLLLGGVSVSFSQNLLHLPALTTTGTTTDSTISFLINTSGIDGSAHRPDQKYYCNSIQIADANQPWPPRWYTSLPYYDYKMYVADSVANIRSNGFLTNEQVVDNSLSFFKLVLHINTQTGQPLAGSMAGYIELNKNYVAVDTMTGYSTKVNQLYWNNLKINNNGDHLVSVKGDRKLDLREKTGNAADSAVLSDVEVIRITDKDENTKFEWNPLDQLDKRAFRFNETLRANTGNNNDADPVSWAQLSSVQVDYDGNILYSLRNVGVGKFSARNGKLMWYLDNTNLPLVFGQDTLYSFSPQSIALVSENDTSATYCIFSLGPAKDNVNNNSACGIVFRLNKKTNRLTPVDYIKPQTAFKGSGQGNFSYQNHRNYLFSYGLYNENKASDKDKYAIELCNNGSFILYSLPDKIIAGKILKLKAGSLPERPVIVQSGNKLTIRGGNFKTLTWYKLDGPKSETATLVANGTSITPQKGETYCVESPYGIGYVVSKFYISK